MNSLRSAVFNLSAGWLSALLATSAGAGGFNLDHQNAAALGAAFAGSEATPGEAAFAAYNPAAIGGVERVDVSASVTGIFPNVRYSNANGVLLGVGPIAGRPSDDDVGNNAVVPNVSIAYAPIERLSVGLVANSTFGIETNFAGNSIARYQAQESKLRVIEIAPMVAYEILPKLVVGGSFRIQYMDLSLTSTIDAGGIAAANAIPGFAPGNSDLPASFNGHDVDFGYALGAQFSPKSWIDIGLAYSSSVEHNIKGNAHFDLGSSAAGQTLNGAVGLFDAHDFRTKLKTPGIVALGARLSLDDQIRLLASVRVMLWSTFDVVALSFNDGITPAETSTQNWRDSVMASVGAEYQAGPSTILRTGFMYDQSPVRDRLAIARIPDGDRYWISFGASQAITSHISADLGFAYAIFADRKADLDGSRPENTFRGSLKADFRGDVFAASMGVRWKF